MTFRRYTFGQPLATGILMLATLLATSAAFAGDVAIPNTFQANNPAVAAEVNGNFSAVETAVDDNDSRIDALLAAVATLQGELSTLQTTVGSQQGTINAQQATINNLQGQLVTVQNNSVLDLDGIVALGIDSKGYDAVRFTGVNVQIVNGMGQTESKNGLGNLTIGYNETSTYQQPFCSDGNYANQTNCANNSEVWAADQRSGSHNLILGLGNAYSQYGGLVVGFINTINGEFASVSGGSYNDARGESSSVSGGSGSIASGDYSSVNGGLGNNASGQASSVSGGRLNYASGDISWVSGGVYNIASGDYSSISGGNDNDANGDYSSVSGGHRNTANGQYSSVSGGENNDASGDSSSVSGGNQNTASSFYSSVSGGSAGDATGPFDWRAGALFQDD